MPEREHAPSSGLWRGTIDLIERMVEAHMFVKTESDRMVPRLQALARPAMITSDFIPDSLLRQVTQGRRHFVDLPPGRQDSSSKAEEHFPPCPLPTLLQCVEKLNDGQPLPDGHLQQLWAFLASEVSH